MSKRRGFYPVMLGHHLRKGILTSRDTKMGGFNLFVVWLKKEYQSGEKYEIADIDAMDTQLHFCDKESVVRVIESLLWILENWETK